MNVFLLILFHTMVVITCQMHSNQTANCHWMYEMLCGDKCVKTEKTCTCGEEEYDFVTFNNDKIYCCHNSTCLFNYAGNVECHGGKIQKWWEKCDGNCVQKSVFGWVTLPCKTNDECYIGIDSCQGIPKCKE